jgi:hypothetical protein
VLAIKKKYNPDGQIHENKICGACIMDGEKRVLVGKAEGNEPLGKPEHR